MGIARSMLDRIKRAAARGETPSADDMIAALQVARAQGVRESTITSESSEHYNPALTAIIAKVPGGYEAIPPASPAQVAEARVERTGRQQQFWANREAERKAPKATVKRRPKAKPKAKVLSPEAVLQQLKRAVAGK